MPRATVVIPVHNGAKTIGRQLSALVQQQRELEFEVVVVDNNSNDSTADVVASYAENLSGLRQVTATAGASVAYARNAGALTVTTEAMLFCDADDIVRPGWVRAMMRALLDYDIVGGVLDVSEINSREAQSWTGQPPTDALPTTMRWRSYATGANMGMRRSVWEELRGFDETFVGGHEEVDFAWRAQDLGRTLGWAGDAVVDYALRSDLPGACWQRFHYGRTYAQLYERHQSAPIPRARIRHEVRVIGQFLLSGPSEALAGRGAQWLVGVAWTLGRWRGDLVYRVRCPL